MRQGVQPSGIPVSRALIVRPGIANDALRAAIEAINRVHGDGNLPAIPVEVVGNIGDDASPPVDGRFAFIQEDDGSIVPLIIYVRWAAPIRGLVLLHEIGHFLDANGLPGLGFSSVSPEASELDEWREAVVSSQAYRVLTRLQRSEAGSDRERAASLRRLEELWARSYAQFVTVRSDSVTLRAGLETRRRRSASGVYYPIYWEDADFVRIESAIERVFRRMGWIGAPEPRTSNGTSKR